MSNLPVPVRVEGLTCIHEALLLAEAEQCDCVVSVTLLVAEFSENSRLFGVTVYVQGAAVCSTVKSRPAMLNVADRAAPELGRTPMVRVAGPVPVVFDGITHAG